MSKMLSTEFFTKEETTFNKAILAKLNPSVTTLKYFVRLSDVNGFLFPLFEGEPATVVLPLRRSHLNDKDRLDEYLTQSFWVKYMDYSERMALIEAGFYMLVEKVQKSFRSTDVEVKADFSTYGMTGYVVVESKGQPLYNKTYFMNEMREWFSVHNSEKEEVRHIVSRVKQKLAESDPNKKKREEMHVRGYIDSVIEGYGQEVVFDENLIQYEKDRIGRLPAIFLKALDPNHRTYSYLLDETLNRHRKMFDMLVMMIKTATANPNISDTRLSDQFMIEREMRTDGRTVYHVTEAGETEQHVF